MRNRARTILRPLLAALTVGTCLFGATAARADSWTATSEFDTARTDPATGRMFVAHALPSRVDVFSGAGALLGTIPIETRAFHLALGAGKLFVTLPYEYEIAQIDVASMSLDGYIPVSPFQPYRVVYAAGRVWFSALNDGSFHSVDPQDPQDLRTHAWQDFPAYPGMESMASDPSRLILWWGGQVSLYDASTAEPTLIGSVDVGAGEVRDVEVAADGSFLYAVRSSDAGGALAQVRLADMQLVRTYGAGILSIPWAVAVSPNGGFIAAAESGESGRVFVYSRNDLDPVRVFGLEPSCSAGIVAEEGLTFNAAGGKLVAAVYDTPPLLRILDHATIPGGASAITMSGPSSDPSPGDHFVVSGSLNVDAGDAAGRSIEIWKTNTTVVYGADLLKTVTTGPGGSFSFGDVAGVDGGACYTARFAGDDAVSGSNGVALVEMPRVGTHISIDSVSPTAGAPGDGVTISGSVTADDGSSQSGRALLVRRETHIPTTYTYLDAVAGAGGAFSFVDHPDAVGVYTYSVLAQANERYEAAETISPTEVTVERLTPDLRLDAERDIDYGQGTVVTIHLAAGPAEREVSVYQKPAGKPKRLIFEGVVPPGGLSIDRQPSVTTSYSVSYAGDVRYREATDAATTQVHGTVRGRLRGGDGSSGDYRLYHSTQNVYILGLVIPAHPGKSITIDVERRRSGGGWRGYLSDSFDLRRDSTISVYIPGGTLAVGISFRTRLLFSDEDHAIGRSSYRYFRVTAGRSAPTRAGPALTRI